MRAQFLLYSKLLHTSNIQKKQRDDGRHRAPFFVLSLMYILQLILIAFTPLYVGHVAASDKLVPALKTDKQQEIKLEKGTSGKPLKNASQQVNDPSIFKASPMQEKELVAERDQFKEVFQNADGSKTEKHFFSPKNYKKDDQWKTVDTTLIEDTNAANSGVAGSVLGKIQSLFKGESTFKVKDNDWQAKFATTTDKRGMLRIEMSNQVVTIRPLDAKKVAPLIRWVDGKQYVNYYDIWPGVNLEYTVGSAQVKLNVVLKDKNATNNIGFKLEGANLVEDTENKGAYKLEGALANEFVVTPINLILNNYGFETKDVYRQEYKNGQLRMWANEDYLKNLPDDAFPAVIDPNFSRSMFGSRAGGNYLSIKSDGYVCYSNVCNVYAGSLQDAGGAWRSWRGFFHSPYSFLSGKDLINANLHLTQRTGASFWTGNYDPHWFAAYSATCLNSFYCLAGPTSPGYSYFGTAGDINVTEIYRWAVANGNYGHWLSVIGEECACGTYKNFDPDNSFVDFTYTTSSPMTTAISPSDKAVIITDQPTLSINSVGANPSGDIYKYYFRVSTNPDAETGNVINSGDVDATTWTIPEGALQDGQTYYWHAYTSNWVNGSLRSYTSPNWVRSFKFDARTGKDSTQTYDTAGPISVGLATGNATTSASTHSISALGGSIGVGLEYNSPVKSKPGLLGEYFNNTSFSDGPSVTRIEQKIDFNWITGSPSFGTISPDNFTARYSGYFIAPKTGDYYFGSNRDDVVNLYIDNNLAYSGGCCGTSWATVPVSLSEGQVVPIRLDFTEIGGGANVSLLVKGVVAEQVVPTEWLRTPLRQTDPVSGLQAHYYSDPNNAHVVPTDTGTAFASRIESQVVFNYGLGSAVPTGPTDAFISSHTGYITVPATGSYQFGTTADDAARVWINDQLVVNDWAHNGSVDTVWGSDITLSGGRSVPIRIEYYEIGGGAALQLNVRGAVNAQNVPATWLSSKAKVLPSGWQLSIDADGSLSYDFARVTAQTVTLYDASGDTHVYTWNGSVFKAPENEYGIMTRNLDGTVTLQDSDGLTYVFNGDGTIKQVTNPIDDQKPASLRYEYSGIPARLTKIVDGVDSGRFGTLHYKGDSSCTGVSGGLLGIGGSSFDTEAPDNMLCAFSTTDGDKTSFFYVNGQLARIELPGGDITDIGYDSNGRIIQQRSSLANDAISAGVRGNDAGVTSEISYDAVGRVSKVTEPAPNAGDPRREHTYQYLLKSEATWSSPEEFTGPALSGNPVITNWGGDKLALVQRDTNSPKIRLYQNGVWDNNSQDLGPNMLDDPGIASWADGRFDIFIRGTDNQLWTKVFADGTWVVPNWTALGGGSISSSPSATSWSYQRYDVVARGMSNELLHRSWTPATGWTNFGSLGGCLSTAPALSTRGINKLEIYVSTCSNPATINSQYYWLTGWTGFGALTNEAVASSVVPYSTKEGQIHVVTRNTANQLRYLRYDGVSWSNFETLAPCMAGTPGITSAGGNDILVVYKGCDGKMYQIKRTSIAGTTIMKSGNISDPNEYSEKIDYDATLRTLKDYDKAGNSNFVEYHPIKDMVLSITDVLGSKSTTIYDQNDLPTENYGPAPKAWFDASRRPLPAYVSQIPRSDTKYDEGINGLNVAWYNAKGSTLFGAPKLHTTGINPNTNPTRIGRDFRSTGQGTQITADAGMEGYGFRATGKITFPNNGTYTMQMWHDDGARLYVDNKLIFDQWQNRTTGVTQVSPAGTFVAIAGKSYDIRLEYIHINDAGGEGAVDLWTKGPGIADQHGAGLGMNLYGSYVKPDYNLQTSTKVYDAQLGDTVTTTNYGPNPELGLANGTTVDPTGLNYTNSVTYETQGAAGSYLRQTSRALPGGSTTTYVYYSAQELPNPAGGMPCGLTAVSQAGRAKITIEQDPDGLGSVASRTKEVIYDAKGRSVAGRTNNDPWTCTYFDTRGRTAKVEQPTINGRAGRTVEYFYDIAGNPFKNKVTDSIVGSSESEIDLLGRSKWAKDIWGNEYTSSYDANGRVSSKTSPVGTESSDYDSLDRPTNYKLDGLVLAAMNYDIFGRVSTIEYPEAKDSTGNKLKLNQTKRDALERSIGSIYQTSDNKLFDETLTLSQSGKITGATQMYDGQTLSSSFTFDKLGRMLTATVGQTKYEYGYGAPDASCVMASGYNAQAHKNSNRTNYKVTNLVSNTIVKNDTHCYDLADRLVTSTDSQVGTPTYDDHGNIVSLAGAGTPITLAYNASDQNVAIEQGTSKVEYVKTASGAIVRKKEYVSGSLAKSWRYVAGGRILQSCSLTDDNACTNVDTYIGLPGAVSLTKSPSNPATAKQTIYSLKNYHGDTTLTFTSEGKTDAIDPASNLLKAYGPFGESLLPGTLGATTSTQINATDSTMGWASHPSRKDQSTTTDSSGNTTQQFTLPILQMGARVYIPTLGRFLQVDPIEGGTLNAYVYAHDPVNMEDYSGLFSFRNVLKKTGDFLRRNTNASRGYGNYLLGRGAPMVSKITDFKWDIRSIVKSISGDYKGKSGDHSFGVDTKYKCFDTANIGTKPLDINGKNLIGTGAVSLKGILSVSGNNWSFKGKMTAYDYYDFDVRLGTKGSRGLSGEAATMAGAFGGFIADTIPLSPTRSTNFVNIIQGEIDIDESGTFN